MRQDPELQPHSFAFFELSPSTDPFYFTGTSYVLMYYTE